MGYRYAMSSLVTRTVRSRVGLLFRLGFSLQEETGWAREAGIACGWHSTPSMMPYIPGNSCTVLPCPAVAGCLLGFSLEEDLPEMTGPRVIVDVYGGREKVKFVEVRATSHA